MTCAHCSATITNGLALCERCRTTLDTCLTNIADYYADLFGLPRRTPAPVGRTPQSTPPPAVDEGRDRTSDVLLEARRTTVTLAQRIGAKIDRLQPNDYPESLARTTTWIRTHAEHVSAELKPLLGVERRLKDALASADTGWYAGVCGHIHYDKRTETIVDCEAELYAVPSLAWVTCPRCGSIYDVASRREAMLAGLRDHLAPLTTIARLCVTMLEGEPSVDRLLRRLQGWVERNQLQERTTKIITGRQTRMYAFGDVLERLAPGLMPEQPESDAPEMSHESQSPQEEQHAVSIPVG